jgi:hypothetical protein
MRWLKQLKNRFFRRPSRFDRRATVRLGFESLENRVVPAVTAAPLPMGDTSLVNVWINDQGQVAGTAAALSGPAGTSSGTDGFVWTAQGTQTIFPGGRVLGENNAGQVLGIASDGTVELWDALNGVRTIALPQGSPNLVNAWVNDQGQVAGTASSATGQSVTLANSSGFVWTFAGGTQVVFSGGQVLGENNAGQVLGIGSDPLDLWDTTNGITPVTLPADSTSVLNGWINDQGQVAGTVVMSTGQPQTTQSGFVWTVAAGSQVIFSGGQVLGENSAGQVLGIGSDPLDLWDPTTSSVTTVALPANTMGLVNAWLNSQGQVAGTVSAGTGTNGFTWSAKQGPQVVFAGGQALSENSAGQVAGIGSDGLDIYTLTSNQITFTTIPIETYGDSPITLDATASSGLPVSYTVISGPATIVGNTLTITGAGMVTVEATQGGNADFPPASPVDQSFTVSPAHLTVTANPQSRLYGLATPTFTYTIAGFVNGENAVSAGVTGTPVLSTNATPSVAGSPYAINVDVSGMSASNYEFTGIAGQLAITKAHLTVTANAQNRLYGQDNPVLTFTITGFANGENATSVSGSPVLSTTATSSSPVTGSPYAINIDVSGMTAANYDFTGAAGQLTVNPAHLTVTADPLERVYGQTDIYDYSLSGFVNGETAATSGVSGTPVLSSNDTATSPAGQYTITVGRGTLTASNYDFANLVNGTLTIDPDGTSVELQSNTSIAGVGQPVTFTATVKSASPGRGTPDGMVTFWEGTTWLGTATLQNGVATLPVSFPSTSTGTVTATYTGSANFSGNVSAGVSETILPATKTSLTLSRATSVYGQPVTFTATVAPTVAGRVTKFTGTVTFMDGNTVVGTAPVNGNVATFTTNAATDLGIGTRALTAVYGNDVVNGPSTSATQTEMVTAARTFVTLTTTGSSAAYGQPVTLTAKVTQRYPSTVTPTGTITFMDGSTQVGTTPVVLVGGVATVTTTNLPLGKHGFTAIFTSATVNDISSSSSIVYDTINKATTHVTFTPPPTTTYGQPVTFTAKVDVTGQGVATPTGTVTFTSGGAVLGSVPVTDGNATLTTAGLPIGYDYVRATYSGDANTRLSTALSGATITKVTPAVTFTAAPNPASPNQMVTLTAKIDTTTGSGTPTGMVTFTNGSNVIGSAKLVNGVASFTTKVLAGSYRFAANYNGDVTFRANTSPVVIVTLDTTVI